MIIICNGAFKSGSTWLLNIVRQLVSPQPIGDAWRNAKWNNPSISPDRLADFLKVHSGDAHTYVSKNHLATPAERNLLLGGRYPDVRVLNITRDIRDVVVSAYYHSVRVDAYDQPVEVYFRDKGLKVAARVCAYNELWSGPDANLFVASYERLHLDGAKEIASIARFLGLERTEEQIQTVHEKTRFDSWKERTGSPHMRKGIIGDWKNHLTESNIGKLRARVPAWAFSPEAD
jgi:hypothetical protein